MEGKKCYEKYAEFKNKLLGRFLTLSLSHLTEMNPTRFSVLRRGDLPEIFLFVKKAASNYLHFKGREGISRAVESFVNFVRG
jgi:hypothetical protein